jgi:hypothetical protein
MPSLKQHWRALLGIPLFAIGALLGAYQLYREPVDREG